MSLKELLGEELYNQVKEKVGDKKLAVVSDGSWLPKEKFDAVNEERKQHKAQIGDLEKQLGDLKGQLKDNEGAMAEIEKLQKQIADKETELTATRKANAIRLDVLKAGPNDVADILPHIKQDAVTIGDDGAITGLDEQLTKLKEAKPYLFKAAEPQGTGGSKGAGAKQDTDGDKPNYGAMLAQKFAPKPKQTESK